MLQQRHRHDPSEIKARTAEVVSYYLGAGHPEGDARLLWDCPACQKPRKLALRLEDSYLGCLVDSCELHKKDALDFIAFQESLHPKREFAQVLARGAQILGLDNETPHRSKEKLEIKDSVRQHQEQKPDLGEKKPKKSLEERLALCDEVYSRVMELCPLEDRDRKYLRMRGLSYETIEKGAFGSISGERSRYLKKKLLEEFDKEKLLEAPGFFTDGARKLGFTLSGDYLLIPYYDRSGRITTIEGRARGEIKEGRGKYTALRGSGSHLYLFPGFEPERTEAFTEGSFGAMVAAENGIAIASIQGCERYRASSSTFAPDGEGGEVLLELRDTDLGGRTIPYIPDADDPPNENVLKAARKAAHHLVERQGGRAALCSLPKGMDLDEWLLSLPHHKRKDQFKRLLARATPLAQANEWEQTQRNAGEANSTPAQPENPSDEEVAGPDQTAGEQGAADENTVVGVGGPLTRPAAPATEQDAQQQEEDTGEQAPDTEANLDPNTADSEADTDGPSWESAQATDASSEARTEEVSHALRPLQHITASHKQRDEVYRRLLEHSPLKGEHMEALAALGVSVEAARTACLGSLDGEQITTLTTELRKEFGTKRLLKVPGFEHGHSRNVTLGLPKTSEYVLFPLFEDVLVEVSPEEKTGEENDDAPDGPPAESEAEVQRVVSAIEALEYDPKQARFSNPDRTLALKGAGANLYLFPAYLPEEIEGFCEGPLGALLAAEQDVVLGAVGHFRRYTADGGMSTNEERVGQALPQLAGVDFGGREITYFPKTGPGEENARSREARVALDYLITRQNGTGKLVALAPATEDEQEQETPQPQEAQEEQQAPGGPTSLSEWLLGVPEEERHGWLRELFARGPDRGADPLSEEEQEEPTPEDEQQEEDELVRPGVLSYVETPTGRPLAVIGTVSVAVSVVCFFFIHRVQSFSEYVGVGYGGQPMIESGPVGALRPLLGGEPFTTLYDMGVPVSVFAGIVAFFAGVLYHNRLRVVAAKEANLGRFAKTAVWSAHHPHELAGVPEESAQTEDMAFGAADHLKKTVLESSIGSAIAFGILYPLALAVEKLYSALAALGAVSASYEGSLGMLLPLCVVAALMCGAYVGMRRSAFRREEGRLADGTIKID